MDLQSGEAAAWELSTIPCQAVSSPSFKLFPKLAAEIQLMIFEYALPGPRTVKIEWCRETQKPYSRVPPPALLHVCCLSREETLKTYTPLFTPSYHPLIYISPMQDNLSITAPPHSPSVSSSETPISNLFTILSPLILNTLTTLTLDRRLWCHAWSHSITSFSQTLSNGQLLLPLRNLSLLTITMQFSKDLSKHKRTMNISSMMCALDIVSTLSYREEPSLYGKLRFARRFVGLNNRIEGLEWERRGWLEGNEERVRRDLVGLGERDGEWRVPEVRVVGCVEGKD